MVLGIQCSDCGESLFEASSPRAFLAGVNLLDEQDLVCRQCGAGGDWPVDSLEAEEKA